MSAPASTRHHPAVAHERSPVDVLRMVVAGTILLILLLVGWVAGSQTSRFLGQLFEGLGALPDWLATAIVVGTRLLTTVLFVGGIVAVIATRRLRLLATTALAAAVAAVLAVLVDVLVGTQSSTLIEVGGPLGTTATQEYPTLPGLAVIAAVFTAAAPWLDRRWRRVGWVLVIGTALSRFVTAPVSLDTFGALTAGWFAGALALVILGGPVRRPDHDEVAAGLAAIGIETTDLTKASVDARGSTPWFAKTSDGTRLFVKALGQDERSADLLFRIYRTVMPRDFGDESSFSSLRRTVEHEAMIAMAARELGVPTPPFVALATVDPDAFVLVYEAIEGSSLDGVEPDRLDDAVVAQIWQHVARLRSRRIAHRDLRLANLFLGDDDRISIIDFGFSELAASDLLLANDLAELLSSLALVIGPERSIAAAAAAVGPDAAATAIPRLKPYALSGATRTALKSRPEVLTSLVDGLTVGVAGDRASAAV